MQKEELMKKTIELAISTIDKGNTPFGAIITKNGEIIAAAVNEVTSSKDVTAHAELLAIRKATKKLGSIDLSNCELYASGEPCSMCLTAIYYAAIKTVYVAYPQEEAATYDIGNPYVHEQIALPREKRDLSYISLTPSDCKHPYKIWLQNKLG